MNIVNTIVSGSSAVQAAKEFYDEEDFPAELWDDVVDRLRHYPLPMTQSQIENDVIAAVAYVEEQHGPE